MPAFWRYVANYSYLYRQCTYVIYAQRQIYLSFSSAILHKHELYIFQEVCKVTTIKLINFSLLDRLKPSRCVHRQNLTGGD
jgi:hypothetical protein